MKLKNRLFTLFLALIMLLAVYTPALAAETGTSRTLTRGEFITALYALAEAWDGEAKQDLFDDVPAQGELALAVDWAAKNGIINGYGDRRFGPDDPLTREQLAVMLYRNGKLYGEGFQGMWYFLLNYPDAGEISDWADEAMHWMVMKGIFTGSDKGLEPKAAVTKGELDPVLALWRATLEGEKQSSGIDYLALVNKTNPLPEGWEEALETVTVTNSVNDEVVVEAKAYEAYQQLKADLEENDGIYLELDSAFRSVAAQQEIMEKFIIKYGADYASKTVAQPGYSEHHTGLALDLYFKVKNDDGSFTDVYHNEDMEKEEYAGVWAAIHAKLAKYGFILRYLDGMEHVTGYRFELWHIRYVDSPEIAEEIMSKPGLTLEEYLAGKTAPQVEIDLSGSTLYTDKELYDAMLAVKCQFAAFAGCELHSIRYGGDEANTQENIKWVNELAEGKNFTQVCEILTDFHSPTEPYGAWETDKEYKDWQWWLARTEGGDWQLLTWGY